MDTIAGMRAFAAVAAQTSFTQGAKQLGISTKLASKYVRQLEEKLGAQLLNRTTRSVTLTETGQVYFQHCVSILEQLDELDHLVQARQTELAGTIRITAPTTFGGGNLVEAILPFQEKHPKVVIDLHLSDRRVSLIDGGFDLAIRFGSLEDSSLVARKLLTMRLVVCASPDYLKKHGMPNHPSDLEKHNCLILTGGRDFNHWRFNINGEVLAYHMRGSFRASSPRAVAQMAASGLGITMCPLYAVKPLLAEGRLQLLFEDKEAIVSPLCAVYPSNRYLTTRVRALIDHLVDTFK